jgi:hypothetical protein
VRLSNRFESGLELRLPRCEEDSLLRLSVVVEQDTVHIAARMEDEPFHALTLSARVRTLLP